MLLKAFKGGKEMERKNPKWHLFIVVFVVLVLSHFPTRYIFRHKNLAKRKREERLKNMKSFELNFATLICFALDVSLLLYDIFIAVSACLITTFVKLVR
jgi:uncharacterized membrane protein